MRQEVGGDVEQLAGRDIHQHQTEADAGRIEVSIRGSNISIGAVYANLSVQIVIEGGSK